jgi:tungstate transport system substrate-binding protein
MDRENLIGIVLLAGAVGLLVASGCREPVPEVVKMATTTSAANTGLLDTLLPEFEKETGIRVDYIATGTGKAMMHGRNGDVDVVLVHAPEAEKVFVQDGYGVERVPVMWNDFVILGPPEDAAEISISESVAEAMKKIEAARASFISRGDDSGTHKKELAIWKEAEIEPAGDWYIEAGQGMGACLTMANDKQAYVLTDRGTYLSRVDQLELQVVFEGDPSLLNPYAVIAVNPEKYPDTNQSGAQRFIEWMTSPRGQSLIEAYRINGKPLFHLFE